MASKIIFHIPSSLTKIIFKQNTQESFNLCLKRIFGLAYERLCFSFILLISHQLRVFFFFFCIFFLGFLFRRDDSFKQFIRSTLTHCRFVCEIVSVPKFVSNRLYKRVWSSEFQFNNASSWVPSSFSLLSSSHICRHTYENLNSEMECFALWIASSIWFVFFSHRLYSSHLPPPRICAS